MAIHQEASAPARSVCLDHSRLEEKINGVDRRLVRVEDKLDKLPDLLTSRIKSLIDDRAQIAATTALGPFREQIANMSGGNLAAWKIVTLVVAAAGVVVAIVAVSG